MKPGPLGCIIKQEFTEATCLSLSDQGHQPMFADGPGISGHWQGLVDRGATGVYLWRDEHDRLGAPGADYQKRGTCFPRGTEVMTSEGITLPIETLRAGDEVYTHRGRPRKVLAVGAYSFEGVMASVRFTEQGETQLQNVMCTNDHEFCILDSHSAHIDSCVWVAAKDLQPGQLIVAPIPGGHQLVVCASVKLIEVKSPVDVFNIDVEEDESFMVNGLAVHNCVGRGSYRAMQQSYHYAITSGTEYGRPAILAYEPGYIGSREVIGRGQLGNGDGSVGAWYAEWGSQYGMVERKQYASIDLRKDNENFATSHKKVPADILEEGKRHTFGAHLCKTFEEVCDALASGFAIARCHNTLYGNRNSNGESTPSRNGAHCQAVVGVYLRPDGSTGLVEQQSWGGSNPGGPSMLRTKGGPVQLPESCYGISKSSFDKATRNTKWWEAWAFSVRAGQGFRDQKGSGSN